MNTCRKMAVLAIGLSMALGVLMAAPSTADAQEGSGLVFATVATCIESDTVQGDPAAATMGVGNVYEGNDGTRHLIVTGGPSCSFNCAMGFDANCDGERGDYCSPSLNLSRVSDVGTCLASMTTADDVESVPAVPVAASTAEGLAYTGAESAALAYMGAGLLSAGAFIMGVRRKTRG